jgi:hypothetical protein
VGFFSFITHALISPVAGVWVDRLDRRLVMILSDIGAGLMTTRREVITRQEGECYESTLRSTFCR